MNFVLKRLTKDTEIPTFGVLFHEGQIPFALTLERPWRNNEHGISCITPAPLYVCKRIVSPKFGNTFQVMNVPGRDEILIHKGNIQEDSHGCILIGEQFGSLQDEPAVLAAKEGFAELMRLTSAIDEFNLEIKDCE